jgi:hypothetical protein
MHCTEYDGGIDWWFSAHSSLKIPVEDVVCSEELAQFVVFGLSHTVWGLIPL